jgi:NAD-dependent dihydropyrimidine dehydrogenase PreA subunit
MAHHTVKTAYLNLYERLNKFPQGAPYSETLFKILEMLFNEQEARLVAQMPIRPFGVKEAATIWEMSIPAAQKTLDELSGRALLVDLLQDGEHQYVLPPPMAGFFEFSLMRFRGDIDQKALSELFYQYLNVEEAFVKELFTTGETGLGRVFVHEPALPSQVGLQVLDYERASEVINTAEHIGIGVCYCRHKLMHMEKACSAPMDICMTFNTSAGSLIKQGFARSVDAQECTDLLHQAYEHNLVQFGDNVTVGVNFVCNCCGCCCEAMLAARRFGPLHSVHTTNFLPSLDSDRCKGCGKCVNVCPVEAMLLASANDPKKPKARKATLDEAVCLGCGVCVRACPSEAITLESRAARVITPHDSAHRIVLMAIERGTLQELLLNNKVLWNHRLLAAVLGVVLRLPPLKQAMASEQVRSRYVRYLIERFAA